MNLTQKQIEKQISIERRKADKAKYLYGSDLQVREAGEKLAMLYDALRNAKRATRGQKES